MSKQISDMRSKLRAKSKRAVKSKKSLEHGKGLLKKELAYELNVCKTELDYLYEELEQQPPDKQSPSNNNAGTLYRNLFQESQDAILIADDNAAYIDANPAACELFGYSRDQLLKKSIWDITPHMDEESGKAMWNKFTQDGQLSGEYRIVTKNGDTRVVDFRAVANVLPEMHFTVLRDITHIRETEESLKDEEEKYLYLFENMRDALVSTDMQGHIRHCNPAFVELLGYSLDELKQLRYQDLTPERWHKGEQNIIEEKVLVHGYSGVYEKEYIHKDGTFIPVELSVYLQRDSDGHPDGMWGIARDLTEQKRVDNNLQQLAWLLEKEPADIDAVAPKEQSYGDLTELNKDGLILQSVGKSTLDDMAANVMALLDTSLAVYEENGDYAYGLFVSSWCRLTDDASRKLCNTPDNQKALDSGQWLCHESCWNDASRKAMEAGEVVDIACMGGIRIYAVPIRAENRIVGSVNIGYGNPPTDIGVLKTLADTFKVDPDELAREARNYKPRPQFIIDIAKRHVVSMARLIGEIIERKQSRNALAANHRATVNLVEDLTNQVNERKKTEQQLKERNTFIETILDNLPIGLAVNYIDQGTATYMNRKFEEIYGWPKQELQDIPRFFECVYPDEDYRKKIVDQTMTDIQSGDPERMQWDDVTITQQDGRKRIIYAKNIPLYDQNCMISTVQDITEKRLAERKLAESEEMFKALFESMVEGVAINELVYDDDQNAVDYRIIDLNSSFLNLTNYEKEFQSGMLASDFFGATPPPLLEMFRLVFENEEHHTFETYLELIGKHVLVSSFSMPNKRFATMFLDMSDHVNAEKALKDSEFKYKAIFENSPIGIAQVDMKGRILSANSALQAMLGYPENELSGTAFLEISHPEDTALDWNLFQQLLAGKRESYTIEKRFYDKNEHILWVNLNTAIVTDEESQPLFLISMIENVSKRKDLEKQLVQSQKMEAIGRLAGGIAHDFNNLLTVINGYGDLLQSKALQDEFVSNAVSHMLQAGKRAASLTGQLLAFSRKQLLKPVVLDVNQVIPEIKNLLSRMVGEDMQISTFFTDQQCRVKVDRGQFEQVLMNLIVNARDAMPDGGTATLRTAVIPNTALSGFFKEEITSEQYVEITITDTGVGMDKETMRNIFEPFYTTKTKGTGLGLATVYGIIKQSAGHVRVDSKVGTGTTFSIYLPLIEKSQSANQDDVRKIKAGGNETVLVVEDEANVRDIVREVLTAKGYTVYEADSGESAITNFLDKNIQLDLLITDVVMPGIGGRDVADRFHAARPDLKIMYMTGYTDDKVLRYNLSDDDLTILQKPFEIDELLLQIRQVLDG